MLEGIIGQKIPAPKIRSKRVHHWKEGPVGSWEGVTLKPPPAIPCYTYTILYHATLGWPLEMCFCVFMMVWIAEGSALSSLTKIEHDRTSYSFSRSVESQDWDPKLCLKEDLSDNRFWSPFWIVGYCGLLKPAFAWLESVLLKPRPNWLWPFSSIFCNWVFPDIEVIQTIGFTIYNII